MLPTTRQCACGRPQDLAGLETRDHAAERPGRTLDLHGELPVVYGQTMRRRQGNRTNCRSRGIAVERVEMQQRPAPPSMRPQRRAHDEALVGSIDETAGAAHAEPT